MDKKRIAIHLALILVLAILFYFAFIFIFPSSDETQYSSQKNPSLNYGDSCPPPFSECKFQNQEYIAVNCEFGNIKEEKCSGECSYCKMQNSKAECFSEEKCDNKCCNYAEEYCAKTRDSEIGCCPNNWNLIIVGETEKVYLCSENYQCVSRIDSDSGSCMKKSPIECQQDANCQIKGEYKIPG